MNPINTTIQRDDGPMPVLRWVPDGKPRGGVVLVHEIFGVSDYIQDRAADLAAEGYLVDAPVLYFRQTSEPVPDDAPDLLEQGMTLAGATDWETAVADVNAAVHHLLEDMEDMEDRPVALVGFCYGGGLAYAAAAAGAPARALVSYYGSALPSLTGDAGLTVDLPSLHHFGTADAYIPMEKVEAIREHVTSAGGAAGVDVEVHLYDGAGHAFDNPLPPFHAVAAAADAWPRTLAFLERMLTA